MDIDRIIDGILEREGGYIDHPADRGGPTHYGITQRTLEAWRGRPVTAADVRALTSDEARVIYRTRYVEAPGFAWLPEGPVQTQLVDHAVLSGPRAAVRDLQTVVRVPVDGVLGPITRGAVAEADPAWLNTELVKARAMRLAGIVAANPSQVVFLRGWLRRALSFL